MPTAFTFLAFGEGNDDADVGDVGKREGVRRWGGFVECEGGGYAEAGEVLVL